MDYEREDKIALERALLALHICPKCRGDLIFTPVVEMWECVPCRADYRIPREQCSSTHPGIRAVHPLTCDGCAGHRGRHWAVVTEEGEVKEWD